MAKSLMTSDETSFAEALSRLSYCNPFLQERLQFEREALGSEFIEGGDVWNLRADWSGIHPNNERLTAKSNQLVESLAERLRSGARATADEARLYEDLVLFFLYNRYQRHFLDLITRALESGKSAARVEFFNEFASDVQSYFDSTRIKCLSPTEAAHLFACFFQLRRAFHLLFHRIVGGSIPAAKLRAAAWQSIFTADMKRFRRVLFNRMANITTLIVGPSGTGKELVASAIGHARYIPFNPQTRAFAEDFTSSYYALNISALSPTLIESELFGHKRGAFTGALQDHAGWLELCNPHGTVFLDEIGEVEPNIQVKLLRVLQTRRFQRLGESENRVFEGKIIAATNRDLEKEMREGNFREDFYYRLCSDVIHTPTLASQLEHTPDDLRNLILFIARVVVGEDEADELCDEVAQWVDQKLPKNYRWPGNFRELEQCVRNIMIRGEYHPPRRIEPNSGARIADAIQSGDLSADDLLSMYCTHVYAGTGNFQETARRLSLDHRTVKSRIDWKLLETLTADKSQ
jgi:transcriptional regulator of acetoin/glycerol metabolism